MQGVEGVGTQCVEAVSMRKSFSCPHAGTSMTLCLLSMESCLLLPNGNFQFQLMSIINLASALELWSRQRVLRI